MNDEPRQTLCELLVEYGRSLCADPQRCEALLKDHCGAHKREIFVLVSALKHRVAADLLQPSAGVPPALLLGRLTQRLEAETGLAEAAARWAVESWALALDVIAQPLPMVTPALAPPPRAAETLLADRYQDNGDGTVTDVQTGLQWMRFSLGQEWKDGACIGEARRYECQEALNAVDALICQGSYAGYRDWRVPSTKELLTLVYSSSGLPKTWNDTGELCEGDYESPTIYKPAFPNTPAWKYWAYPLTLDLVPFPIEGYVDFSNGNSVGIFYLFGERPHKSHVRLVRGGQDSA